MKEPSSGLWPMALAILLVAGCSRHDKSPALKGGSDGETGVRLEDDSAQLGVSFVHSADGATDFFFPSIMTGGAALCDLDQDGHLDILLLNSRRGVQSPQDGIPADMVTSRLYLQREEGRFTDATAGSGFGGSGFATGCTAGDINNDGRPDVYVTAFGRDQLFLNEGNGRFRNITETAGITNERWGTSAAFLDFDRDGWLDLFVANYVDYNPGVTCDGAGGLHDFCNPAIFPRTSDRLYRNSTGDTPGNSEVRFKDVTLEAGIASAQGAGLGAAAADFDGDGWIDIYVANDGHGNFLWINQQNGTFEDQAVLKGVSYDAVGQGQGSMGLSVGDLNGDGLPDLVVANLDGESNAVYTSRGSGTGYTDTSMASGISAASFGMTGFGIALGDIENDGDPDMFVANGRVRRKAARAKPVDDRKAPTFDDPLIHNSFWGAYAEHSSLLLQSAGVFADDPSRRNQFVKMSGVARSLCPGDINNDGRLDFLVTYLDRPAAVFINKTDQTGHWLSVRLIEPELGGRDAIGAHVTLLSGSRRQDRWLIGGGSYQCVSDFRLHFGMHEAEEFDSIEVTWPNGDKEIFPAGRADELLSLSHGSGSPG